jgi:hypothetical protein
MIPYSPEYLAARDKALRIATAGFAGVDETDPTGPSGHAYGVRKSAMLTSDYRQRLRRGIVDVRPEEVIDCLNEAEIKNWCLMGLHGYVGYLPMPRATQDVDVMVPFSQKKKAADAVAKRWPMLKRVELAQVVRFMDETDLDPDGNAKPVVDIMLPWGKFQETILEQYVLVDEELRSRYPTVEAAIASKYAALISPNRSRDKKAYDAADFRKIIRANHKKLNRDILLLLGNQIWEKGGDELLSYVDLTIADQPLPGV